MTADQLWAVLTRAQQQLDHQLPSSMLTHIADAQSAEQSQEATSSQPELPQLRKALQQRLGQRLTGVQFILSRERVLWRRGWLAMPQVSHICLAKSSVPCIARYRRAWLSKG